MAALRLFQARAAILTLCPWHVFSPSQNRRFGLEHSMELQWSGVSYWTWTPPLLLGVQQGSLKEISMLPPFDTCSFFNTKMNGNPPFTSCNAQV